MNPDISTVKKMYAGLLDNTLCKDVLSREKDHPYYLRKRWEILKEKEMRHLLESALHESYTLLLDQHPDLRYPSKKYQWVYSPSDKIVESRYKYFLGVDSSGYGWNLVGKVLHSLFYGREEVYPATLVYMMYRAIVWMVSTMDHDESATRGLIGKSPYQILETANLMTPEFFEENAKEMKEIYTRFTRKQLDHLELYFLEFRYPGNLAYFVRKEISPFINFMIDDRIRGTVWWATLSNLQKTTPQKKWNASHQPPKEVVDKILTVCFDNRLPMEPESHQKVTTWKNGFWREEKIHESLSFLPYSLSHFPHDQSLLVLSENNERISPLSPSNLQFEGKVFPTVLHLTYYKILCHLGTKKEDAFALLVEKDGQGMDPTQCDMDYFLDQCTVVELQRMIRKHLLEIYKKDTCFQKELLLTPTDKLSQIVSSSVLAQYDPFFIEQYLQGLHDLRERGFQNASQMKLFQRLASLSSDPMIQDHLEYYYFFLYRINLECESLDLEKSLVSIKNLVKLCLPSIYILFKNLPKEERYRGHYIFCDGMDLSISTFFMDLLHSLVFFFKEVSTSSSQEMNNDDKKKNNKSPPPLISKICTLYTLRPKPDTLETVYRIFCGPHQETTTTATTTRPPHNISWRHYFTPHLSKMKTKNKDHKVWKDLERIAQKIFYTPSYIET